MDRIVPKNYELALTSQFVYDSFIPIERFIPSLLASMGVAVSAGRISSKITVTVASLKTTYTWQVYDSSIKKESFITGTRNFINDNGAHYGEVYYDGITINDWETNAMAARFYETTYAYSSWYVNRWTVASGNSYV